MWNLAMVLFPIQRFSTILQDGLGLQAPWQTLPLHVWSGYAILVWSTIHAFLLSVDYAVETKSLRDWWKLMFPYYFPTYTEGDVNFAGWLSFFALLILSVASRPVIQHYFFEWFYVLHVISAGLFLIFAHMHDYNVLFFLQPALAGWTADWEIRRHTSIGMHLLQATEVLDGNTTSAAATDIDAPCLATVESVCVAQRSSTDMCTIIALHLPIPAEWPTLQPGMHVYLNRRQTRLQQGHPFSISSVNYAQKQFTLHIKNSGDWTKNLIHKDLGVDFLKGRAALADPLKWSLEGPYGGTALLAGLLKYEHVIFLAGGVGLTGVASLASVIVASGNSAVLVWSVKTSREARLLVSLVDRRLQTRIHITGEHEGDDPSSIVDVCSRRVGVHYSCGGVTGISIRNKTRICLSCAMTGIMVSFLLGRLLCCNKPAEWNGERVHACRMFRSTLHCSVCDTPDESAPSSNECCNALPCYYCFRGAPMLLSIVLTPIWTWLTYRIVAKLWLHWTKCLQRGYHQSHQSDDDVDDSGQESPVNDSSEQTNITWSYGRVDMDSVWSEQLPSSPEHESAVVICGPDSFVDAVRLQTQSLRPRTRIFIP
jgi:predicted ferric reductase